jgi:hypothetical protein
MTPPFHIAPHRVNTRQTDDMFSPFLDHSGRHHSSSAASVRDAKDSFMALANVKASTLLSEQDLVASELPRR